MTKRTIQRARGVKTVRHSSGDEELPWTATIIENPAAAKKIEVTIFRCPICEEEELEKSPLKYLIKSLI